MKNYLNVFRTGSLTTTAVLVCTVLATGAKADCGLSGGRYSPGAHLTAAWPETRSGSAELSSRSATDRDAPGNASIVGLWKTTFISGGQVVDQGFDQWNSDGTEILNDTPPPATGNVCLGVWVKSGENSVKLKHPSWTFDANGNLTGTAIIREQVSVDPKGNTYKGTFTVDVFDLAGNPVFHLAGTLKGERITVD